MGLSENGVYPTFHGFKLFQTSFSPKNIAILGVSTHLRLSRGLGTSLQPRVGTPTGHLLLWLRSRQGRRHQSIWVVYGIAFFTSFSDLWYILSGPLWANPNGRSFFLCFLWTCLINFDMCSLDVSWPQGRSCRFHPYTKASNRHHFFPMAPKKGNGVTKKSSVMISAKEMWPCNWAVFKIPVDDNY